MYKPGSFLRIPLVDGSFGYGRVLELPFDAFYNYRTTSPDSDLERIASKPILFRIVVSHPYPKSWELIGWREIEERLTQPIVQFSLEVGPARRCTIFDNLGNEREASPRVGEKSRLPSIGGMGPCVRGRAGAKRWRRAAGGRSAGCAPGRSRGRAAPQGICRPQRPTQAAGRRGVGFQRTR
ncbi:immunity 26/phosphotriesterase HocA family protein [Cystobacter ferrugineus]|uniref:immunity 26/phosphotriesterase HocA family protein n=1 Tax=Cystobacter ferrugineus TaxID=83449 RepID=UPI001FEC864A|nr:immunity 26/phosphotriesterase HocA family protein [Cystobacter ferrugineus]